MAPKMKPAWSEADFIYDPKWDTKVDGDFIDYLSFEARIGNFEWPHRINPSLLHAINTVNYNHGLDFSYDYGIQRLDLLLERYNTFSWMLDVDKVSYDASTNLVTAPDEVWNYMVQTKPFATAYLTKGEAKFDVLSIMFAPTIPDFIIVSSNEETMEVPSSAVGKYFVHVDEAMGFADLQENLPNSPVHPNYVLVEPDYVIVDEAMIEQAENTMAVVPYQPPVEAIPLQAIPPLDLIDISSSCTQSSLFNWCDFLDFTSDDEGSTATDGSTARSCNFATSISRGIRRSFSRCKSHLSPVKPGIRLSSTASNSPLAKPQSK